MTRLMQAGFEVDDTLAYGAQYSGNAGNGTYASIVSSTPSPRSGTYCDKSTHDTTGAGNKGGGRRWSFASQSEIYLGFGFYSHASSFGGAAPGNYFCILYDTAGNGNIVVTIDSGTIHIYAVTGGTTTNIPTTVNLSLIGTASATMSYDAWHLIELHFIANTSTGGTAECKIDGVSRISVSSVRTAQTNANYGQLGLVAASGNGNSVASLYNAFDDVRLQNTSGSVNNSWPGDEAIKLALPNAAGDSTQFSRGGTDTGNNYSQANEVPPDGTTTYVFDSVSGHLDLYNTSSWAIQSISAVNVIAEVMNSDGGGGQLYLPTKTGAGQSDGSAVSLTGTPSYQNRLLETDPADSAAWTQTKFDALQLGFKVV